MSYLGPWQTFLIRRFAETHFLLLIIDCFRKGFKIDA